MADHDAIGFVYTDVFDVAVRGYRQLVQIPDVGFSYPRRHTLPLAEVFGISTPDTAAPTFAGINSLIAINARTVRATWLAGNDVITDDADLRYEVHFAKTASAPFTPRAVIVGDLQVDFEDLLPETTYYARVRCLDEAGNVDGNSVEREVTTPVDIAGRPSVAVVSPGAGATIVSSQAITFDVTDDGSFRKVLVFSKFTSGIQELIHNGNTFSPFYANSTRSVISGGYRYVVTRAGGWPSGAINFEVVAIDTLGNENNS